MKKLIPYIKRQLSVKFAERITEADKDSDKWYELIAIHEDESTETLQSAGTFKAIFAFVPEHLEKYGFDKLAIYIWENPENPEPIYAPPLLNEYLANFHIRQYYTVIENYEQTLQIGDNKPKPIITSEQELYGPLAENMLKFLNTEEEQGFNYAIHRDNPKYKCVGVFRSGNKYTAFDNLGDELLVESYHSFFDGKLE